MLDFLYLYVHDKSMTLLFTQNYASNNVMIMTKFLEVYYLVLYYSACHTPFKNLLEFQVGYTTKVCKSIYLTNYTTIDLQLLFSE